MLPAVVPVGVVVGVFGVVFLLEFWIFSACFDDAITAYPLVVFVPWILGHFGVF